MKIANPIYDVVFKYLMDDNKLAKIIISKIIGEKIQNLAFQTKENVVKINFPENEIEINKASFTVYRLDFAATIKLPDNSQKQVLIEIQKAKFPTDIMRFRRYLGQQYSSDKNCSTEKNNGLERTIAHPIISIYILGHPLEHILAPVVKVNRTYIDMATGSSISDKEEFIESLSHDSYVIQIPKLKGNRRTELECMLSIFDQSQKESNHILNINEHDFPTEFSGIIRKLQSAIADETIQNTMNVEDEVVVELEKRERFIDDLKDSLSEQKKKLIEKDSALKEKDSALKEKDSALKEKDSALKEKDSALKEKDSALKEKNRALDEKDQLIAELKRQISNKG